MYIYLHIHIYIYISKLTRNKMPYIHVNEDRSYRWAKIWKDNKVYEFQLLESV